MKRRIIRAIFDSMSPYEQFKCRMELKEPSMNEVMLDLDKMIDRNWKRSATYKATRSNDGK